MYVHMYKFWENIHQNFNSEDYEVFLSYLLSIFKLSSEYFSVI